MKHTAIALLFSALGLQATAEVLLVPAGEFAGRDGRPGNGLTWKLNDRAGQALAARLTARHGTVKFNLDYEHQTMLAEKNGQPAPASGWATKFEWRPGVGLYATDVQWTARAKQMIEAGEYAYISPVIVYDKTTGEVVGLHNAALVNIPNLEMSPFAAELMARLNASFSTTPEIDDMNPILLALLTGLGLTESATQEQATTALANLKAQAAKPPKAVLTALNLAETATEADATTAIASLRAKSAQTEPDPTKWVSLDKFNELNTQVAALKASATDRDVDALIAQAKAEGKLMPAAEEVWRNVGKADIAQLRALIDKTPGNPALAGKTQTDGRGPAEGDGAAMDARQLQAAANKYMAEQESQGNLVTSAEAVNHVLATSKKG